MISGVACVEYGLQIYAISINCIKEHNPECTVLHIIPSKFFALLPIIVPGDQLQPYNHSFSDGIKTP
jgi:hypothetical protein